MAIYRSSLSSNYIIQCPECCTIHTYTHHLLLQQVLLQWIVRSILTPVRAKQFIWVLLYTFKALPTRPLYCSLENAGCHLTKWRIAMLRHLFMPRRNAVGKYFLPFLQAYFGQAKDMREGSHELISPVLSEVTIPAREPNRCCWGKKMRYHRSLHTLFFNKTYIFEFIGPHFAF